MLRAIWEWLWPPHCDHEWSGHARVSTFDRTLGREDGLPIETRDTLICKRCGKITTIKL